MSFPVVGLPLLWTTLSTLMSFLVAGLCLLSSDHADDLGLMSFLVAGLCLLSSDHPDYFDVFPGGWFMAPVFGPTWLSLRLSWWLVYVFCLRITLVTLTSWRPVYASCLWRLHCSLSWWLVYASCLRITLISLMSLLVAGLCLCLRTTPCLP